MGWHYEFVSWDSGFLGEFEVGGVDDGDGWYLDGNGDGSACGDVLCGERFKWDSWIVALPFLECVGEESCNVLPVPDGLAETCELALPAYIGKYGC